ncbi:hypothetical protein [Streptomyces uncialis]|uniref:hypothetical protein n=1 Tax=Streptomyces uncialis TaxID=1048205 RepID=UPI0038708AF9|nr:hypothetical protein OG924_00310 [Streptomyces uncialis]
MSPQALGDMWATAWREFMAGETTLIGTAYDTSARPPLSTSSALTWYGAPAIRRAAAR